MIRMHNNILQGKVYVITVQLPRAIPSNLHDCYLHAIATRRVLTKAWKLKQKLFSAWEMHI